MDSALDVFEGLPQPRGQDPGYLSPATVSTHPPVFLVTFIFPLTEVQQVPPPSFCPGGRNPEAQGIQWMGIQRGERQKVPERGKGWQQKE